MGYTPESVRVRRLAPTLIAIVALLVTACGADGEAGVDTTSTTDGGAATATTEATPDTVATATTIGAAECPMDGPLSVMALEREQAVLEQAKSAFEADHPDVTVEIIPFASGGFLELAQAVVADAAIGNAPHVIMTGLGNVTFAVDALDAVPIDETALSSTYERRFLGAGTVDGELYVVPYQVSAPIWFYNKDMWTETGLDPASPPVTHGDLLEQLAAVAETFGGEKVYMGSDSVGDWYFQNAIQSAGAELIAEDGTPAFDTPEAREGLSIWETAVTEGWQINVLNEDARTLFIQGELAMVTSSSANLARYDSEIGDAFEWGVFLHPYPDGAEPFWAIGGSGWAILAEEVCEAELSTEFIGSILSPDLIAESNRTTGYVPVDNAAYELLEEFYAENPAWAVSLEFDDDLVEWGGWRGERGLEANLVLQDAMNRIAKGGESVDSVISDVAEQVAELVAAG